MPEKAARYFIKIENIRVERLQDISEFDALEEGVVGQPTVGVWHSSVFSELWDDINDAPFDWDSNPFVWVYEFALCEKPLKMIYLKPIPKSLPT